MLAQLAGRLPRASDAFWLLPVCSGLRRRLYHGSTRRRQHAMPQDKDQSPLTDPLNGLIENSLYL